MRHAPHLSASLALLLAACTVGPDYVPPQTPEVPAWKDPGASDAHTTAHSDPDPQWWNGFDDPILDALIAKAIAGNPDVQQAVLRVVEARQGIAAARAAGLPSLGGNAAYKREQLGAKGILESQGVYSNLNNLADKLQPLDSVAPHLSEGVGTGLNQALNKISDPVNLYQYGLDSSWELDLFGKVRRSVEQAKAQTEAQAEALNDALVMLESEVAQMYVHVRGAQALKASQEENVKATAAALDLTQRRQRTGLTTDLDVSQAQTQFDDAQRQLPIYDKQLQQAMNALSLLTGQTPGTLDTLLNVARPLPTPPPLVQVGVPAALARRRPDIRRAEAQLHAATASVGVAVASFYPDISLTGSLGVRALDASYLASWASLFYSVGPSISLPIFQGGRITSNLRLARAQTQEAALHYRGVVLNALREVEDALVAYRTDRVARDQQARTVRSAELTLFLARDQYAHGLTQFIQVLDAERTAISQRQQLVQADMQLVDDVVALYRALGGGWEQTVATVQTPLIPELPPPTPAALDGLAASVIPSRQ